MLIVILLGTVTLHECEKDVPGSTFGSVYAAFVKAALTTMNCAAVDPQDQRRRKAAAAAGLLCRRWPSSPA